MLCFEFSRRRRRRQRRRRLSHFFPSSFALDNNSLGFPLVRSSALSALSTVSRFCAAETLSELCTSARWRQLFSSVLPGCGSFAVQSDVAFAVFEVHARLARDAAKENQQGGGTARELDGIVPWSPSAAESSPAAAALEARVRGLARDHAATPKFDFDARVRPLVVAYNRDASSGMTGVVSLRARDVRVVDAETGDMVASGAAVEGDEVAAANGDRANGDNANAGAPSSSAAAPALWVDFGLRSASTLVDPGDGELEIVEFAWYDVVNVGGGGGASPSCSASRIKASRTGGGGLQLLAPLAPPAPGAVPSELTGKRPLESLAVQVTLDSDAADELMREKSEVQEWVARQAAAAAAGGGGAKKATLAKMSMCVFFFEFFVFLFLFLSTLFPSDSQPFPLLHLKINTLTKTVLRSCRGPLRQSRPWSSSAPTRGKRRRQGRPAEAAPPQQQRRKLSPSKKKKSKRTKSSSSSSTARRPCPRSQRARATTSTWRRRATASESSRSRTRRGWSSTSPAPAAWAAEAAVATALALAAAKAPAAATSPPGSSSS